MYPSCDELFPGVYLLRCVVGGRPLSLPLLVGTERVVLLDTGCSTDVREVIIPSLQALGIGPERLSYIITSHSDFDHRGGNHAMKAWAPQALLCCGEADRTLIEDPRTLYRKRYDCYREEHGIFYPPEVEAWILAAAGDFQAVDLTFLGGEKIRLSPDWEVEVLALPGHSPGHLGLLDRKHDALYAADAMHGAVYLTLEGKAALCPTYATISSYKETIHFIESLGLDCYCGCHWPLKWGAEVGEFCHESLQFVDRMEARMLAVLQEPRTLREICDAVGPALGDWPRETDQDLVYAAWAHLTDLSERGLVRPAPPAPESQFRRYILSSQSH